MITITRKRILIPLLIIVLAIIVSAVIYVYSIHARSQNKPMISQSTNAPVKSYITGLMNRSGPPDESLLTYNNEPLIKGFVIQVNWKDVQPNSANDFDTSAIDQQLAFAKQHNLAVRMRIYAGYNTPQWVMNQTGSVSWSKANDEAGPDSYNVPKFWTKEFQDVWKAFYQKLSDKYDSNPELKDVVPGVCITNFAEPFIRQFSNSNNKQAAQANGYTDQSNDACLKATIDMHAALWPTTHMAMAFNPYQSYDSSVDKNAEPKVIIDYCRDKLGSRCVIGNNSMTSNERNDDYSGLYKTLHDAKLPMYIQTATDKKIGDWQKALNNCIDIGALSIELPSGYQNYDKSTLQSFNAKLANNLNALNH